MLSLVNSDALSIFFALLHCGGAGSGSPRSEQEGEGQKTPWSFFVFALMIDRG